MSMTVIFSDFGDTDTQVLTALWKDAPEVNLVHITRNTRSVANKVKSALVAEKDTLLICGHGSPGGLLSPNYCIVLGEDDVRYIRARRVIGIWCHAAQFAERVGLKGFFSSMFISNINEAFREKCYRSSPETITREEILFCERVNRLMLDDIPQERWVNTLCSQADLRIDVVKFNYNGLRYFS